MRPPIRGVWAKLSQNEDGEVVGWHPLSHHAADVAACCEALLERTLLGRRLATLANVRVLSRRQVARLCFIAAIHDLGKPNHGFQNKAFPGRTPLAGHVREVAALFGDHVGPLQEKLLRAIRWDTIEKWSQDDGTCRLLIAAISHHGKPLATREPVQEAYWKTLEGRDPFAEIGALVGLAADWFPDAFSGCTDSLPASASFQHAFSGLVMLADWLGSDTRFFPFSEEGDSSRIEFARARALEALKSIGVETTAARNSLGTEPIAFGQISPHPPRPLQEAIMRLEVPGSPSVTILEAETGSGKTEAALAYFLRLFKERAVDGLYFALPTRTAATQIHGRLVESFKLAFPFAEDRPLVVLAVPGYLVVDESQGHRLPHFEVLWNDDPLARYRYRGWAAEHPKRYLAACASTGTIDQVLLGTLAVSHAHMRMAALSRLLLVVDEVHASDAYMNRLLEEVLRRHAAAGGHAFLMSATLGSASRSAFAGILHRQAPRLSPEKAAAKPYPLITRATKSTRAEEIAVEGAGLEKRVRIELVPLVDDASRIAAKALAAAKRGARLVVLRNTVADCLLVQRELEELSPGKDPLLFRCGGLASPHHSRFAKEDREQLDRALEVSFGKDRTAGGLVCCATQTIQQSLDIDVDFMITDLCPMDVLLQRIGRLQRHQRSRPEGFENATCVVLVPAVRDLSGLIRPSGEALGRHGFGSVYDDLRILEATWRSLEESPALRIPGMNRTLVEKTTHPEVLESLASELGGRWKKHTEYVVGLWYAHRRQAGAMLIDWSQPFGDYQFPSEGLQRRIATRLGESDRLIDFPFPLRGAFGGLISRISIPAWMARGIPDDPLIKVEKIEAETSASRLANPSSSMGGWG